MCMSKGLLVLKCLLFKVGKKLPCRRRRGFLSPTSLPLFRPLKRGHQFYNNWTVLFKPAHILLLPLLPQNYHMSAFLMSSGVDCCFLIV